MPVKGLTPGLLEVGKIKIGKKGAMITSAKGNDFRPPEKLDHFIITTNEKREDGDYIIDENLTNFLTTSGATSNDNPALLNDKNQIIGIPIRLMFNDVDRNFPTRYASYVSGRLACSGDGQKATTIDGRTVDCPCERLNPGYKGVDKCKINGVLSCIIDGVDIFGGCHKFRTTSRNTCQSIIGSMMAIQMATSGVLAFLPLTLIIQPKNTTTGDGQNVKVYVVSVVYLGDVNALRKTAAEMIKEKHHYVGLIEQEPQPFESENDTDIIEEFYPEAVIPDETAEKKEAENGHPAEPAETERPEKDSKAPEASAKPEKKAECVEAGPESTGPAEPKKQKKTKPAKTKPDAGGSDAGKGQEGAGPPAAKDAADNTPAADFGGRQADIVAAYKELIQADREVWQLTLKKAYVFPPVPEIDNIAKSKKWDDPAAWGAMTGKYTDDDSNIDELKTAIDDTIKYLKQAGGKKTWEDAMAKYGLSSARFISANDVDEFVRLIQKDIPF